MFESYIITISSGHLHFSSDHYILCVISLLNKNLSSMMLASSNVSVPFFYVAPKRLLLLLGVLSDQRRMKC